MDCPALDHAPASPADRRRPQPVVVTVQAPLSPPTRAGPRVPLPPGAHGSAPAGLFRGGAGDRPPYRDTYPESIRVRRAGAVPGTAAGRDSCYPPSAGRPTSLRAGSVRPVRAKQPPPRERPAVASPG